MSADKAVFHAKLLDCLVDRSLDASGICDDASVLYDILEVFKVFDIIFYRSTEKNIVAAAITVIFLFQYAVNGTAVQCGSQSFLVFCICEDVVIRMKLADRFCNLVSLINSYSVFPACSLKRRRRVLSLISAISQSSLVV